MKLLRAALCKMWLNDEHDKLWNTRKSRHCVQKDTVSYFVVGNSC
jgi:hypothetical protein